MVSVLGPILYLLYTSDLPKLEQNVVATFADDTAIMAIGDKIVNQQKSYKLLSPRCNAGLGHGELN
jgi:hypothetical protein